MIVEFAKKGNLRSIISTGFNNILWSQKIHYLFGLTIDLKNLHNLDYCHRDLHSGNILQNYTIFLSDFGLSGPADEQKSDDKKVYGVLPYIAPEVLNGEPYTKASDIYSIGILMTEMSSGKSPFYDKKHDHRLSLAICEGLRPEFGKGTPEFYKKLAYRCMDANPNQRPTASELRDIFYFWYSYKSHMDKKEYGYYGREIGEAIEEANKEIPNISISYQKDPDAVYTSRAFTFSNLPKPVNSSLMNSYLKDEDEGIVLHVYIKFTFSIVKCTHVISIDCPDSQLVDLNISSSLQLKGC